MMERASFLLLFCTVLLHDVSAAVDSASLLWPIPAEIKTSSSAVKALDSEKFYFTTDINSVSLLNQAFQRYKGVIFQAPIPFYPDGAEENVKTLMPMLNVKVSGGDEVLKPDTDESCKLIRTLGYAANNYELQPMHLIMNKLRVKRAQVFCTDESTGENCMCIAVFPLDELDTGSGQLTAKTVFGALRGMERKKCCN